MAAAARQQQREKRKAGEAGHVFGHDDEEEKGEYMSSTRPGKRLLKVANARGRRSAAPNSRAARLHGCLRAETPGEAVRDSAGWCTAGGERPGLRREPARRAARDQKHDLLRGQCPHDVLGHMVRAANCRKSPP